MVGHQHHHGVIAQAEVRQRRKESACPFIDVGDIAVIGATCPTHIILVDDRIGHVADMHQSSGMRVRGCRQARAWQGNLRVGIKIPVLAPGHVRVVRMGEAGDEEERPTVVGAGSIMQGTDGRISYLVVVEELVRHLRHAGAGDARHVVVPPVDALLEAGPVGSPAEVGRVDVSGPAFLEAVQLVRTDEMHLAAQDGAIPGSPQVVSDRRHRTGEVRCIVVAPGSGRQLARHQAIARRRAQRTVAVGVLEDHALGRQSVDMGRAGDRVAVTAQGRGGHLVVHDDQHVGLARGQCAHVRDSPTGGSRAHSLSLRRAILGAMLTPGLIVLHGNRLEDLLAAVAGWLREQPLQPLETETLLVQSQGMGEWVRMQLAESEGISAALRVELPARFLWRAYRAVLGPASVPPRSPLDKAPLTWRLMARLPQWLDDHPAAFAPLDPQPGMQHRQRSVNSRARRWPRPRRRCSGSCLSPRMRSPRWRTSGCSPHSASPSPTHW